MDDDKSHEWTACAFMTHILCHTKEFRYISTDDLWTDECVLPFEACCYIKVFIVCIIYTCFLYTYIEVYVKSVLKQQNSLPEICVVSSHRWNVQHVGSRLISGMM
jgi:hypothetical protein